jgi:trimeric autotransporter adhesin
MSRRRVGTALFVGACGAVAVTALVPTGSSAAVPTVTRSSIIRTLTGTHVAGFSGDGGPASAAAVNKPRDTAVASDGSIFIADTFNNRIRLIAPDGIITTYAGSGSPTFGGDGGPAVKAGLKWPHDVCVDAAGDLFIADSNHSRIRKVTPSGIITTIAGTGAAGFSGDGGAAKSARLHDPKSVALWGGSLYFADSLNQRIRAINLTTGIIRTIAGNGVAGFGGDGGPALKASFNVPQRIAFDDSGNLFVADTLNNRIREIATNGTIRTVVGTGVAGFGGDGGQGVLAKIKVPRGIAFDANGRLFFSDTGNNRVREWNPSTGVVTTIAGGSGAGYSGDGGPAGSARLNDPRGLSFDNAGRLIIADTFNSVIRVVAP